MKIHTKPTPLVGKLGLKNLKNATKIGFKIFQDLYIIYHISHN